MEARSEDRSIAAAPSSLNTASRLRALERATAGTPSVDVLVIGGGITGVGVALDAASRGLRTVLLEANDLGSGTSGVSSKLVHGGLRYLAQGDVPLAWESAVERKYLMQTIAPHLVRPLRFLIPDGEAGASGRAAYALSAAGVGLADALRRVSGLSSRRLPGPRLLGRQGVLRLSPGQNQQGLRGGLVYWDGQVEDDARLVLAVARTAARQGAGIIRDCRVTQAHPDRVSFRDERTGESGEIRAGVVINATGVWAAELEPSLSLTPSRGSHLVLDADAIGRPSAAVTMPVPGAFGRFLFALPQANGAVYFGLTDEAAPGADGLAAEAPEADRAFLLDILNRHLATPISDAEVRASFSGLRPLVGAAGGETADASRHHLVLDRPGTPICIVGGKLTVYRKMAEDAVDAAVARLRADGKPGGDVARSKTRRLALVGAAAPVSGGPHLPPGAIDYRRSRPPGQRLAERFGAEAGRILGLGIADPALLKPILPGHDVLAAEVLFASLAEGAESPADVLERRTRLTLSAAADLASEEHRAALNQRIEALLERGREAIA